MKPSLKSMHSQIYFTTNSTSCRKLLKFYLQSFLLGVPVRLSDFYYSMLIISSLDRKSSLVFASHPGNS